MLRASLDLIMERVPLAVTLIIALAFELSTKSFASPSTSLGFQIPGPRSLKDRIAIVGAGPSGIHMAHLLKSKGFTDVTILEKEGFLGGKSYTVNYRGVAHEMGTVYLSPDYEENIIQLVRKYVPDDLIPLPHSNAWLDGRRPMTYQNYLIHYALTYYSMTNATAAANLLVRAVLSYIAIHRNLFGAYEGEIMPEPNAQTLQLVSGTFGDFLTRHNLQILAPLFYAGHTMQGYGHIDEIAAIYGLMWNTPRFMSGILSRVSSSSGSAGGFYLLKNGFSNLWKTIVKKDGIKIIYNVDIENFWRPVKSKQRSLLKVRINRARPIYLRYDYVIWSPNMKESLRTWSNVVPEEHEYFKKLSHWHFTTALVDSKGVERGLFPIDFWFDNMKEKREHSVWVQRDSYAAVNGFFGPNYQNGSFPSGNDGKTTRTTVAYLMGRNPPPSVDFLKAELLKHFSKIGGTSFRILQMKIWHYFPRFAPEDMEKGILWSILKMQGKYGMWYIGSSVSFESAKSVVEYNKMLVNNMKPPRK